MDPTMSARSGLSLKSTATPLEAVVPSAQKLDPGHGLSFPAPSLVHRSPCSALSWCVSWRRTTSHGPSMRLANNVSLLALDPRPLTLSESRAKEGLCVALMPVAAGPAPG